MSIAPSSFFGPDGREQIALCLFSDIDELHTAVLRRRRISGIEQLLLAEADRFEARGTDVERREQGKY